MQIQRWTRICGLVSILMCAVNAQAGQIRRVEPNRETGSSAAVVVLSETLLHTAQILPDNADAEVAGQAQAVLDKLRASIRDGNGNPEKIAKLNVYISKPEVLTHVQQVLAKSFPADTQPAVSYVTTKLPGSSAQVAMDAVAIGPGATSVKIQDYASGLLPLGSRIYVAGQAEKGKNLAEATRLTLESLERTLKHLGRTKADIVQLKSFLSPMADVSHVQAEMKKFFGDAPVPPNVYVEWTAPLIEIELVAWGGPAQSYDAVEFLTPPGMTASPVYSRVARSNGAGLIYTSGLYSTTAGDAAGEVTSIFEQLQRVLKQSDSDLRHLVKATYYCSNNETSAKLNELRPKYYDPARPPAASKALVDGVGPADRGLTIDMIAVPTPK